MSQSWTELALARLRAESGRNGAARRSVVEFLARQECCLSAQEIHDGVRGAGLGVGVASVYRALEALDSRGLVQRIDLGDGVARYERAVAGGDHHHHFVCDDCGRVEPFEDPALEAEIERIAGGRGFSMGGHEVVLRGACDECRVGPG